MSAIADIRRAIRCLAISVKVWVMEEPRRKFIKKR